MTVVTIIICILMLICFFKTKKIKELYKALQKKESMFIVLYEQKFETLLKIINRENISIQESLIMNMAEMRKLSLFSLQQGSIKAFIVNEEKIEKTLNHAQENQMINNNTDFNANIQEINVLIEETKVEYNNMLDHFNQETSDFFGKQIIKHIKKIKKFERL